MPTRCEGFWGRHHEEGLGKLARLAFRGHLMLFHGLEQRRLRLGRGAIDLVRENQLREDRTRVEPERGALALVHRHSDDVGGQHVAGELDAVEVQPEKLREHLRQRSLADAGQILDQQVPAREQAGKREPYLALLAEDDFSSLLDDILYQRIGHRVRISRPRTSS